MADNPLLTEKKAWQSFKFSAPITESFTRNNNDLMVKGIAINETTTRNGVRYEGAELRKAAPSLRGKPILKDHNNSVESIVGRTTENIEYDEQNKRLPFEGRIIDEWTKSRIREGLITNVSIGAHVQDLAKEKMADGTESICARGIEFVELSFVAVPGDPGAGIFQDFNSAVAESFKIKEKEADMNTNSTSTVYTTPGITTNGTSPITIPWIGTSTTPSIMEKKSEDNTMELQEEVKAKDAEIAALKEKLSLVEEDRKKKAVAEYELACKEKNVPCEKAEAFTTEQVIALTKAINSIPKVEEKKPEVNNNTETPKANIVEGYALEYAENGKGFSLYKKK